MKVRTFLIDDDEPAVRLLSLVASERGHEVHIMAAPDGCPLYSDEACSCPSDSACGDLLLVGANLPGMSGLDLIERQLRRGCKGKVQSKAVLSRFWTAADLDRAGRLGCKTFNKPFLVRDISEWMEERERGINPARRLAMLEGSDSSPGSPQRF